MSKSVLIAALLLSMWLNISGCTSQGGEPQDGKSKAIPATAVETVPATPSDMSLGVDVVGTLSTKFAAEVKSEYLGIVTEVYVTEWIRVKKGHLLAKLDTREVDSATKKMQAAVEMAKASLLEAEASAGRAERESERSRNLKEYGLITQQNLEDADTAKAAARARVSASRALLQAAEEDLRQGELRSSKALIHAPMDGVIALRNVNVGDLVGEVGTPKVMFRIVDNRLLDLVVNIPSPEIGMIKVGQPLVFSTDVLPDRQFRGRITFINPAVDPLDRSMKVTAAVPNVPEVLKGGLFVQGRIVTGERKGVLQAPRTAFTSLDVGGKKGELLIAENGAAQLRAVQTGIVAGDRVEIVSGLKAGEAIITRGGFNVKDGSPIKVVMNGGGL